MMDTEKLIQSADNLAEKVFRIERLCEELHEEISDLAEEIRQSEADKALHYLALELPEDVYNDAIPIIRQKLHEQEAMIIWLAKKTLDINCNPVGHEVVQVENLIKEAREATKKP